MQYPNKIDIIEDEDIEIPIAAEHMKGPLLLRKIHEGDVLEDCSALMKMEKNENELYGLIRIKQLMRGEYVLTGIENNAIYIKVNKGAYWEEDKNYILKQHSLLENREKHGFIKIKSVNFENCENGKAQMKIGINGVTKGFVH